MIALVMTQEEMTKVIMEIQEVILQKLDINSSISDQTILSLIEESVLRFAHTVYLSMDEKKEVIQRTFYAIRKLDVLQEILEDQEITEIMVNGPDQIFIEKQGRLEPYPKKFLSKEKLEDVIQQIVGKVNRTVNESSPIVDVRLQDGSRVNVVLPPVAINGPIVTIRKFPADPITMEHLVSIQSITMQAAEFLKKLVQAKYNIFISGGTGSGKTTFLNALSAYIPKEERIITIEDSAELQIQNIPNLVRLEVRNANLEGKNEVTIRDLIRSALRMRPDRIILGEVRDAAVNVVLPPVAINGPIVTIRKFPADPITMEHLVSIQSITMQAAEFLKKLVQAKYNIFISGGTGSGKTTFLNALSAYIPKEERIITIEDSAELQIQNIPNLVRLEVRNANLEGKNEVTIRDLIRSALRMRPDRIILGEVRDAAAYDLLSVMNTGHDGSLSTGHANSPKDMLRRLEALVLTAVDIPLLAVRSQIASAIDIVVQLGRLRDRSRKVLEIDEMIGMDGTEIIMRPLYCFKEQGEDEKGNVIGQLAATQNALYHTQKLKAAGMELPELFDGHQAEKGDDYAER